MIYLFAFYDDQHHLTVMALVMVVMFLFFGVRWCCELGWKYCIVEIKYIPNTQLDHMNIVKASFFSCSGQCFSETSYCTKSLYLFYSTFLFPYHKPTDTIHSIVLYFVHIKFSI